PAAGGADDAGEGAGLEGQGEVLEGPDGVGAGEEDLRDVLGDDGAGRGGGRGGVHACSWLRVGRRRPAGRAGSIGAGRCGRTRGATLDGRLGVRTLDLARWTSRGTSATP